MSWNNNRLLERMLSCFGVAAFVLMVDQIIKYEILQGKHAAFFGGRLAIGTFYNSGIAFSIHLSDVLLSLAIILSMLFVLWLAFVELQHHRMLLALAAGLVLGGSVGNVIDRLRFGAVIDYIHVLQTSVLNFADIAIASGLFILIIVMMKKKK